VLSPVSNACKHLCREELLRLVKMGFHFKQIKQFIQQEQQQPADGSKKSKYRCALCSGLDGEAAGPALHMQRQGQQGRMSACSTAGASKQVAGTPVKQRLTL
jgi:hypothetical protein